MWECPDFFPVAKTGRSGVDTTMSGKNTKHVLKISLDDTKHDVYTIGTYDLEKDVYVPNKGSIEGYNALRYDYGKYYASKTFYDGQKKRRVLWGWVNESSSVEDDIKKGWSGIQVIFHKSKSMIQSHSLLFTIKKEHFFYIYIYA